MSNFVASNLTKYNAGGTGNNIVADGYIKSIEKVWLDSFSFTAVITTADTIAIANIPGNRKITGIDVFLPVGFAPSSCTINVGISGSTSLFVTSSTAYIVGNLAATGSTLLTTNRVVMNNPAGFQYVLGSGANTIYLSLGVIAMTTPTAGTITTMIRYT